MEKFIPYEKLSKKEKRKLDQAKRQTWGNLNPVTRKPENSKAYNRNKARNWKREISRDPVPGRLTPACLIRLLKALKNPKSVDLALVGIMPKYRNSGLTVFMLKALQDCLAMPSVEYLETNLNLEDNVAIRATWKRFDHIQHKRRRSYIKKLNDSVEKN